MRKALLLAALMLIAPTLALATPTTWLHVHVEDDDSAEMVRVNLPVSLIQDVLPLIDNEHLVDGRVRILDQVKAEGVDVRELWEALRSTEDGEFVTVRGRRENVSVRKGDGYLMVDVEEDGNDSGERVSRVKVRIPVEVVDALFATPASDEIDVLGAVKALERHMGEDMVVVEEPGSRVRVWIDDDPEGKR